MSYIYGKLNKIIEPPAKYTGQKTDTIDVIVDNTTNKISANLIGELGKTYTGEDTDSIDITVDNDLNKISAIINPEYILSKLIVAPLTCNNYAICAQTTVCGGYQIILRGEN